MHHHLLRTGDQGEDVADVQRQLSALGFMLPEDAPGAYGDSTTMAVRTFQHARGIGVDGIVGPVTRRELGDAAWVLGTRPLQLEDPMMRGDDVRALQDRVTTLGFDPGKTDGIFGPLTLSALLRFQREYGLVVDGVCGLATVRALRGLKIMSGDTPIGIVRERERMAPRAAGLVGLRVFLDPGPASEEVVESGSAERAHAICIAMAEVLRSRQAIVEFSHPEGLAIEDSLRARLANTLASDIVVSVRIRDDLSPASAWVRSFGHARYRSIRGERAATLVAESLLEASIAKTLEHELSTIAILRETRACAVVVDLTPDCDLSAAPSALVGAVERCVTLGAYGTNT